MNRRKLLATGWLLVSSGCLSGPEQDSKFVIVNERDSELEVSIRLKDGESAFAVEGFVLDGGETNRFTAGVRGANVAGDMAIAAKILSPQEATYEREEIPTTASEYEISIQPDSLDIAWAGN